MNDPFQMHILESPSKDCLSTNLILHSQYGNMFEMGFISSLFLPCEQNYITKTLQPFLQVHKLDYHCGKFKTISSRLIQQNRPDIQYHSPY